MNIKEAVSKSLKIFEETGALSFSTIFMIDEDVYDSYPLEIKLTRKDVIK